MSEITAEIQTSNYDEVSRNYEKKLREIGKPKTIEGLTNCIIKVEEEIGEKLDDKTCEVIYLGSYLFEVAKRNLSADRGTPEEKTKARLDNIALEQDVTSMVLTSMENEDHQYLKFLSKTFFHIASVFEKFTSEGEGQLEDIGINKVRGLVAGIRGMVAGATLLKSHGWDVRLPEKTWDYNYDIDLITQSPDGKIYPVDITCKNTLSEHPGMDVFHVNKRRVVLGSEKSVPENLKRAVDTQLSGGFISTEMLRINVPPLTCDRSEGFYESRCLGIPTEKIKKEFENKLPS